MEITNLDPRLAALIPVMNDLKALKQYLESFGVGADSQPIYWRAIKWIDDALLRIEPHMHSRRWPPIWWRLGVVDFDLVCRNFYHADTDGYFYEPSTDHPGFGSGYVPERAKIMAWVEQIKVAYKAAQKVS